MDLPDLGGIASRVGELPVGGVASAVRGALRSPLLAGLAQSVSGGEDASRSTSAPSAGPITGSDPAETVSGLGAAAAPATSVTPAASEEQATGGTSSPGPGLDVGTLVEALEERVMAELERRGGRYAGVF